ncbi:MAG: PilW family protein [Tepidisphaeraceae bacterium]
MSWRHTNRRPRFRHGLGLVELLIALAISAALLTAVAVSTDASFKAYAINQEQASLMQKARLTMHRLSTYIRICKEHGPVSGALQTQFAGGSVVTDTGIAMFTDSDSLLDFTYDATNQRVILTENGNQHALVDGVIAFTVKMEPMQSAAALKTGGGFDLLRRATIVLTVRTSGQQADVNEFSQAQTLTLSASVMPRRNSW